MLLSNCAQLQTKLELIEEKTKLLTRLISKIADLVTELEREELEVEKF